jgi:ABC-2 type transport system permease protein
MSSSELKLAPVPRRGLNNLRPGTLPWLLVTQLRVSWRSNTMSRGLRIFLWIAFGLLVVGAAVSAPTLWRVRGDLNGVQTLQGYPLLLAVGATLFLFLLLVSAAISATLEALYERGDLDLLLGAPIRPRLVLASRLLSVAATAARFYAILSVPLLVFVLAAGLWRLLGLVPWLLSMALISASLGGLLTLGLVRWIGVRRARTVASIVGAISGAAFFLVSQLRNLRGQNAAPVVGQAQIEGLLATFQTAGPLGQGSVLWYPARTLWLEPLPTLLTLAFSLGLFALSVRLLEGAFTSGAQQAGMHGAVKSTRAAAGPLRFRQGAWAVLFKEWRLLARDPLLLSRILLQLVYLLPLAFVLFRNNAGTGLLLGGTGILALGSLAGSLAMITTNAEEAPELLLSAPQKLLRLRWLKLWAGVTPVLALWLLLGVGGLLRSPTWVSLLGAALGLWSILGAALIVLWRPLELRRADLFRRGQRSDILMSVSTLLMQGGLMLALFFLPRLPWVGAGGLLLAATGPLLALRGRRAVH